MKLKVMAYNLLYAFHERHGRAMIAHDERAQAAREVIRAEAPDVLALTEAVYGGYHNLFHRPDYQQMFGLEHLAQACYPGDWGNCLLSRFPIVRSERRQLGQNARNVVMPALRATLDVAGRPLHIDVVHPSPNVPEAERVAAFRPLLESRASPYLLTGDFNALSDEDPYDLDTMIEQMLPYIPEPGPLARKMLDRQLIAEIRAAGLRDAFPVESRTHTLPTALDRPHATQGARLRIDYVFASPEFRVEHAAVIRSDAAERASDHYPIVVVLDF